jgi:hypothetical protein
VDAGELTAYEMSPVATNLMLENQKTSLNRGAVAPGQRDLPETRLRVRQPE